MEVDWATDASWLFSWDLARDEQILVSPPSSLPRPSPWEVDFSTESSQSPIEDFVMQEESEAAVPIQSEAAVPLSQQEDIWASTTNRELIFMGKRKSECVEQPLQSFTSRREASDQPTKKKGRRGEHVKERPNMQKTGREGQGHWAEKLQEVKVDWELNRTGEKLEEFSQQLELRQKNHTRARLECLLRTLQMCAAQCIIQHQPFVNDPDTRKSFLGWAGFTVLNPREFKHRIQALHPTWGKNDDKTLNGLLRDAGLVPVLSWPDAWAGRTAFTFNPDAAACNKTSTKRENAADQSVLPEDHSTDFSMGLMELR